MKMKTSFKWNDVQGNGYITSDDFFSWVNNMARLFPNMSEKQKEMLETKHDRVFGDILGGKGKRT